MNNIYDFIIPTKKIENVDPLFKRKSKASDSFLNFFFIFLIFSTISYIVIFSFLRYERISTRENNKLYKNEKKIKKNLEFKKRKIKGA